jgi:hypothetical protein
VAKGGIPSRKIGGRYIFPKAYLKRWLEGEGMGDVLVADQPRPA